MSPTLKVVLLGDLGVGKTCLRSQFVHHVFSSAYKATIGGDFLTTSISLEPTDTDGLRTPKTDAAGQETSTPDISGPDMEGSTLSEILGAERDCELEGNRQIEREAELLHRSSKEDKGKLATLGEYQMVRLRQKQEKSAKTAKTAGVEESALNIETPREQAIHTRKSLVGAESSEDGSNRQQLQTLAQLQNLPGSLESPPDEALQAKMDPGPHAPSKVSLQIWDTAGQERFNLISQAFYRGAHVAVLVYDITNYELVLGVRDWFERFWLHCHVEHPGVVIVGNKADRASERCVDQSELRDVLCRNAPGPLEACVDWENDVLEISCKLLASVEAVFRRVAAVGLRAAESMPVPASISLERSSRLTRCAC